MEIWSQLGRPRCREIGSTVARSVDDMVEPVCPAMELKSVRSQCIALHADGCIICSFLGAPAGWSATEGSLPGGRADMGSSRLETRGLKGAGFPGRCRPGRCKPLVTGQHGGFVSSINDTLYLVRPMIVLWILAM